MRTLFLLLLCVGVTWAQPPRNGELEHRASFTQTEDGPAVEIVMRSKANRSLVMVFPLGTPFEASGGDLYLNSATVAELAPGEVWRRTISCTVRGNPEPGPCKPSANSRHKSTFEAVRKQMLPVASKPIETQSKPSTSKGARITMGSAELTLKKSHITLDILDIACTNPAGFNSHELVAAVVALDKPFPGRTSMRGHLLRHWSLGKINGGGRWPSLKLEGEIKKPPPGSYVLVLSINERRPDGTVSIKYFNFPGRTSF